MSIKGIDTQIMVARTTEASRDSSLHPAQKGEQLQQQLALQAQGREAHETRSVSRAEEIEQAEIRQGGQGGGRQDSSGGRRAAPQAEAEAELDVGFGDVRRIDIKI